MIERRNGLENVRAVIDSSTKYSQGYMTPPAAYVTVVPSQFSIRKHEDLMQNVRWTSCANATVAARRRPLVASVGWVVDAAGIAVVIAGMLHRWSAKPYRRAMRTQGIELRKASWSETEV